MIQTERWNFCTEHLSPRYRDVSFEEKILHNKLHGAYKTLKFSKKILDSMGNEMGNWFSEQTIYSQFLTQLTKPNL